MRQPLAAAEDVRVLPRRWAHWPRETKSPYYAMFYGAMGVHGVVPVATLEPTGEWLARNDADAIHVHWPESLWRQHGKSAWARLRGIRHLGRFLRAATRNGLRVIWTVHNIEPHERGDWIDNRGFKLLGRHADLLICHSRHVAGLVSRTFAPQGDVLVMPHGNFEGVFPSPRPRASVLREFGLDPALPVVSCIGYLRPYKGLELACAAAATLGGRVQLLIAGPSFRYDLRPLRKAMAAVPHGLLVDRRLTDQEFADLIASSDASLLPYSNVTTSGVIVASWTLNTGVIASDLPVFREMIPEPTAAARLFRTGDPESLAAAIESYLTVPLEERRRAAGEEARRYQWPTCVLPVAQWLERLPRGAIRPLIGQGS